MGKLATLFFHRPGYRAVFPWRPVAILLNLLALAAACGSPTPRNESVRIPQLADTARYGRENEPMSLSLVAQMPDPEFKTDRLDPKRYEASALEFRCVSGCPEAMNVDAATGQVSWTPSFEDGGAHLVTFSVKSGIFSSENTFLFFVVDNDRPPNGGPYADSVLKGKEGEALRATFNAIDPDGDKTTYLCVEGCLEGMDLDRETGEFTWTPSFNAAGPHTLKIRVQSSPEERSLIIRGQTDAVDLDELEKRLETDGIRRGVVAAFDARVTIDIENADRPPEPVKIDPITINERDPLEFRVMALDFDGDELLYSCNETCPPGMVVDNKSGRIQWTPTYEQSGDYKILIDVISGGKPTAQIPISIKVENLNRPPYFRSFTPPQTGREGSPLSFSLMGVDPDREDSPTYSCFAGCPAGLSVLGDGLISWIPNFDQSGEYEVIFAITDGRETALLTVQISIAHVNRAPYFVGFPGEITMQAGLASKIGINAYDDDREDVGKLRFSCTTDCPDGLTVDLLTGQIKWFPTYAQSGDYTPSISVTDGVVSTESKVLVHVIKTDRAPRFSETLIVRGEELIPLRFQLAASDPDGDGISFSCAGNCPSGLVVSPAGEVTWTPTIEQSGVYAVTFRATSSPVWDETVFKYAEQVGTIIVRNFNRAPTINNVAESWEVFEGGHLMADPNAQLGYPLTIQLTGSDPDGDPLAYQCVANCPIGLTVNPTTGLVTWTPDYTQAKPGETPYAGIIFAASDGEFEARTQPVSVTVRNVNRPPTVLPIGDREVFENGHTTKSETSPTGAPVKFRVPASDADAEPLSYRCHANCPLGLTVGATTGEVSWTPTYFQAKNPPSDLPYDGIVIAVSDGKGEVLSQPFSIKVKNVNRSPSLGGLPTEVEVFENGHESEDEKSPTTRPLEIYLSAADPDGDPLSFGCASGCPKGLTVNSVNGVVSWRPGYVNTVDNLSAKPSNLPYSGVIFFVTDGAVTKYTSPLSIRVKNVDRAPVFTGIPSEIRMCEEPLVLGRSTNILCKDQTTSLQLAATDPDGDAVTFRCATVTRKGASEGAPCTNFGGTFVYTGETSGNPWLRVTTSGLITASPGYSDALRGNAQYALKVIATSRPTLYAGLPKEADSSLGVRPINIDRAPSISPYYDRTIIKYEMGSPVRIDLYGLDDPDSLSGEENTIEFTCSPATPEACPGNMVISDGSPGVVTWTPSYAQAKRNNAPYNLRFRMRATADDFYPDSKLDIKLNPDGPDYPPFEEDTETIAIHVRNSDHVPIFVTNTPGINDADVIVSEPSLVGELDSKTVTLLARDYDQGGNGIDGNFGYGPDLAETEETVTYEMESCEQENRAGETVTRSCADLTNWVRIEDDRLILSPVDYDTALPGPSGNPGRYYLNIVAKNAPKAEWGWTAAEYSEGIRDWSRARIAVTVSNVDRPPSRTALHNSTLPSTLPETSDWTFNVRATDPDGDTVVYCLSEQFSEKTFPTQPNTPNGTGNAILMKSPGYTGYESPTRGDWEVVHTRVVRACSTPYATGFAGSEASCAQSQTKRLCAEDDAYNVTYTNVDRPPTISVAPSATYTEENLWSLSPEATDPDSDPVRIVVRAADSPVAQQNPSAPFPPYHFTHVNGMGSNYEIATRKNTPVIKNVYYKVCYTEPSTDPTSPGTPCHDSPTASTLTITDVDRPPEIAYVNSASSISWKEGEPGSISYTITDPDPYDANLIKPRIDSYWPLGQPSTMSNTGATWNQVSYDVVPHPFPHPYDGTAKVGFYAFACYVDEDRCGKELRFDGPVTDTDRPPEPAQLAKDCPSLDFCPIGMVCLLQPFQNTYENPNPDRWPYTDPDGDPIAAVTEYGSYDGVSYDYWYWKVATEPGNGQRKWSTKNACMCTPAGGTQNPCALNPLN